MLFDTHFYNETIKKSVAVFGTVFNNIKIRKYNSAEERVPIAYGPKQKFLARAEENANDAKVAIKLPRMSFQISDISYDISTKLNRNNKSTINGVGILYQSVPYNLTMELSILSKTQDDALQIVEQILPIFAPEYTVTIKELEGPDTTTDVPIILNSFSMQDDYEGNFETKRTIIYTLSFTMKIKFVGAIDSTPVPILSAQGSFYDNAAGKVEDAIDRALVEASNDSPPEITTTFGFDNDSP
jgi:hypothetical protein